MNTSVLSRDFSSAGYWEARYRHGGHSGAGSYGRLAEYKAAFINGFIQANRIGTVLDFGCGDGNLLSLLAPPAYTGVDVSPTTLATCAARFGDRPNHRFLRLDALEPTERAELALSIDVIYHLIEDDVFQGHLAALFTHAEKFVLVYASNTDRTWPDAHVRHRRFTDAVAGMFADWRLAAHVPNPYGYQPQQPETTSFADFFVYVRTAAGPPGAPCILPLPASP